MKLSETIKSQTLNVMANALGALVMEMDNKGEGLKDGFGDFYKEYLCYGHNEQFFTTERICEMKARLILQTPKACINEKVIPLLMENNSQAQLLFC